MNNHFLKTSFAVAVAIAVSASAGWSQQPSDGPYKILKTVKVGNEGGFDYVNVDVENRRLYVARRSTPPQVFVYNLDMLEPVGAVPDTSAHGAVIDPKSHHGVATSNPLTLFDTETLKPIKKLEVKGNPDGAMYDPSNQRVYILSHPSPHVTVIDPKDGSVISTFDIGGAPEQAAADGMGHVYIDVEDKENIAVVDTKTLTVTGHYDVTGSGGTCAGLAVDAKNRVLFAACRKPANMVMLNADTGKILKTLPIGTASDGALFNPNTMEAFSSNSEGTLSIVKENSATDFVLEQTLKTMPGAKTSALDTKTNHVILIAAEYGPAEAAAPAADGKKNNGRGPMIPGSFSIIVVGK